MRVGAEANADRQLTRAPNSPPHANPPFFPDSGPATDWQSSCCPPTTDPPNRRFSIRVDDLPAAGAFYDEVLARSAPGDSWTTGRWIGNGKDFPSFWVGAATTSSRPAEPHRDRGSRPGSCGGVPRRRCEYHATYYDGNNIEAVCRARPT